MIRMNFAEQIKGFSASQAAKMIVEMLSRISDERLVQMTYLGKSLPTTARYWMELGLSGVSCRTPPIPRSTSFERY